MSDAISLILQVGVVLGLLLLGWLAGRAAEWAHRRSLNRRESLLADMLVTDVRSFPGRADPAAGAAMVMAEVVVASDYMKTFLAGLRKIIGGELRSYDSLMVRARREAVLRLMEQATANGFDSVCNVRLNTGDIAGIGAGARKRGMAMVALVATGTAYSRMEHGEAQ
jgi:uncharacterized protein YbjQ (UPF0145 family)